MEEKKIEKDKRIEMKNEDKFEIENINNSETSTLSNSMTIILIERFKKFLNKNIPLFTEKFFLYCPAIKKNIFYSILVIPLGNFISIKIEFHLDKKEKNDLLHFNQNEIIINFSIYSQLKKTYIKNYTEKFNVYNEKREDYLLENYIKYDEELFKQKAIFPFILKVQIYQKKNYKISNEFIGIKNEGNTCYFNSIIQTIFNIPIIKNYIFNMKLEKDNKYLFYFQKILYKLQRSKEAILIYKEIKNTNFYQSNENILSFIEKNFQFQFQQDAHEIFNFILDYLNNLNNINSKIKLFDFFQGKISNVILCDKINYKSIKEENFIFLSIECNEDSNNLLNCINNFLKEEQLTGENSFLNEKDNKKYDAIRKTSLKELPSILFLHLKRFTNNQEKIFNKIEYRDQLNMSEFIEKKNSKKEKVYSLCSVIVHEGYFNTGHYYVYCKNFNVNLWFKFNDDKVYEINCLKEVFDDNYGGVYETFQIKENELSGWNIIKCTENKLKTAYLLCYVSNDKIEEYFKKVNINIPKELENQFLKIPNQTSITDYLQNGKNSKKNNENKNNINKKSNINYEEYAGNAEEEEKMLKEAINLSLSLNNNGNKSKRLSLNENEKKLILRNRSFELYGKLSVDFIKTFEIQFIQNNRIIVKYPVKISLREINSPNEILKKLCENKNFQNEFQEKIEKLRIIHLNSYGVLADIYNIFDEKTNLTEFIMPCKYNNILYLYLFENELYYSIQEFKTQIKTFTKPNFIFSKEQFNKIKEKYRSNNFFEILSNPKEILESKDFNSIRIKPLKENYMNLEIKKIIIKTLY